MNDNKATGGKKRSAFPGRQKGKASEVCEQAIKTFASLRKTSNKQIIALLDDIEKYVLRQFVDQQTTLRGHDLEVILEEMYTNLNALTAECLEIALGTPDKEISFTQRNLGVFLADRTINFRISEAFRKKDKS